MATFHKKRKRLEDNELMLETDQGFLELDDGEQVIDITQKKILAQADLQTAAKNFELHLENFGPYCLDYSRNGRHLLLGGQKGHVAAFDWQTMKLMCEMNVMESVQDVKFLHTCNFLAVAQRRWTYIYDNQGIELHCLRTMDNPLKLQFLPRHMLLAAASASSYITWVDVSIGQKVAAHRSGLGRPSGFTHLESGVVCVGGGSGTVALMSPSAPEPLAKIICHRGAIRCLTTLGPHTMVTSGADRHVKVWDTRNSYQCLYDIKGVATNCLGGSQRGLLAVGAGNRVVIYREGQEYLQYGCRNLVKDLVFVPYEDVLGIGHYKGMHSIIVPGAGEPNFDALEANPYETKEQRRQAEVKLLLEKVPYELIGLSTASVLGKVNRKTLQEEFDEKNKRLKMDKVKTKKNEHKANMKRRAEEERRIKAKSEQEKTDVTEPSKPTSVLDRFKKKKE